MKNKKWIAMLLVACTLIGTPHLTEIVLATSAEDKKNQAQDDLKDVNSELDDLKDGQQSVKDEIKQTQKKLSSLLAKQEELAKEIDTTNDAIVKTEAELDAAEKAAAEQYEAMKLRIQYMYENSAENSIWEALLQAKGLTDLINRVEYVAQVHKTDRELTKQYQNTVDTVQEKKDTLLEQMETLLTKEEVFLGQQAEIETMLAKLDNEQKQYASQIAAAQKKVTQLKAVIAEQERIIEEERRRREEEEKKKQEEALKGSVTGSQIVAFARKYVGNPYVWGGNSLTKGCDCSGFVHLVYKHFGFNLPRYSMSFLNVGTKVSIDDVQPGDIVVYNKVGGIGHVAIYIGNGLIVEAQSSAAGITDNRKMINGRKIAGIRRIVTNP